MRYYTIQNNAILIADKKESLTRFYGNVYELPDDYEEGKYIIGEKETEIEVIDPETGETHIEIITIQVLVLNLKLNLKILFSISRLSGGLEKFPKVILVRWKALILHLILWRYLATFRLIRLSSMLHLILQNLNNVRKNGLLLIRQKIRK